MAMPARKSNAAKMDDRTAKVKHLKKAVLYARYSSINQSHDTIEVQLDNCRQHCKRQGFLITGTYIDEAKSGTTEYGRDSYLKMLCDARDRQFDYIIVYKWDRLGRSFLDSARAIQELENNDIRIESATEGSDPLTRGMLLALAEQFSRQLSERITDSMVRAARGGRLMSQAPYGYRKVGEKAEGKLEIEPVEAEVVRRIFAMYLEEGKGSKTIAKQLTAEGVPTKEGRPWLHVTILGILKNRVYTWLTDKTFNHIAKQRWVTQLGNGAVCVFDVVFWKP